MYKHIQWTIWGENLDVPSPILFCFDDRLYSAILRSLEQTHCTRLWFYVSDKLFIARFLNIHRSGVSTYSAGMAGAT